MERSTPGATADKLILRRFLAQPTRDVHRIDAAVKLALDDATHPQILREAGRVNPPSTTDLLDFGRIPDRLNAAELERHLGGTA